MPHYEESLHMIPGHFLYSMAICTLSNSKFSDLRYLHAPSTEKVVPANAYSEQASEMDIITEKLC